jgi:hypothetical protein
MWLQSKPADGDGGSGGSHEFEWSLWKPTDRDAIVKAWTDKLQGDSGDAMTPLQKESQDYFRSHVQRVADNLSLKLVTDAEQAAPLVILLGGKVFVYFGAMSKSCVHLACRLVLDAENMSKSPSVCCCFLNSSYTQKSDELVDIDIKNFDMFDMTPVLTGWAFWGRTSESSTRFP